MCCRHVRGSASISLCTGIGTGLTLSFAFAFAFAFAFERATLLVRQPCWALLGAILVL